MVLLLQLDHVTARVEAERTMMFLTEKQLGMSEQARPVWI
jgi:hypothetical protein